MDAMRFLCWGKAEPLTELCRRFNQENDDGQNMGEVSDLLSEATNSIGVVKKSLATKCQESFVLETFHRVRVFASERR